MGVLSSIGSGFSPVDPDQERINRLIDKAIEAKKMGNTYLAGKLMEAVKKISSGQGPSPFGVGFQGGLDSYSMGFKDELQGLGAAIIPGGQGYTEARDDSRINSIVSKTIDPSSFGIGGIIGDVTPLPFGVGRLAKGISGGIGSLTKSGLKKSMLGGGAFGALSGAGESEADLIHGGFGAGADLLRDTAISGTVGSLFGAGLHGGSRLLKGKNNVPTYLQRRKELATGLGESAGLTSQQQAKMSTKRFGQIIKDIKDEGLENVPIEQVRETLARRANQNRTKVDNFIDSLEPRDLDMSTIHLEGIIDEINLGGNSKGAIQSAKQMLDQVMVRKGEHFSGEGISATMNLKQIRTVIKNLGNEFGEYEKASAKFGDFKPEVAKGYRLLKDTLLREYKDAAQFMSKQKNRPDVWKDVQNLGRQLNLKRFTEDRLDELAPQAAQSGKLGQMLGFGLDQLTFGAIGTRGQQAYNAAKALRSGLGFKNATQKGILAGKSLSNYGDVTAGKLGSTLSTFFGDEVGELDFFSGANPYEDTQPEPMRDLEEFEAPEKTDEIKDYIDKIQDYGDVSDVGRRPMSLEEEEERRRKRREAEFQNTFGSLSFFG